MKAKLNKQQLKLIKDRVELLIREYDDPDTSRIGIVKGMACNAMTNNEEIVEIHIEVVRDESRFMSPFEIEHSITL